MPAAATTTSADEEARLGFIAAASAYAFWGLLPLYLRVLHFAEAQEVLAQRILWAAPSAVVLVLLMSGWRRGFSDLKAALRPRMLLTLCASALFIFLNWGIYVWLVMHERVIESSLAYFLAPLVAVLIGVIFFNERIGKLKIAALALATVGVVVQGFALGTAPWSALALCGTWSVYSVIRKQAPTPAATGLLVETLALMPIAWWLLASSPHLAFTTSLPHALLLALAGPVTAAPLVLFAFGARRVSFSTLGLLQFLAPSIQFGIGVAFGEPFTPLRAASFAVIWIGLVLFSLESWRQARTALAVQAATG